ncbi:MAG: hypothetical protein IID37_04015 [Planctomycetes bacterium]|nr:hypothetical protein [Planctomycetota bacterium]
MKSILGIVAIALVICVLFTGALALATDFVWGCPGQLCSTSWTEEIDWQQGSGFPDDANDNASITSAGYLINYDPDSALTINNLTLTGDSPTWRKLHIRDAALTVNDLHLNDYAELDIDDDLTVEGEMIISGDLKIDVAANKTLLPICP